MRTLEDAIRSRLPGGVAVDFRYAVDAGRVRVDGVRFGDAVLAIVQNAGEAMEATGGRMLVATARGCASPNVVEHRSPGRREDVLADPSTLYVRLRHRAVMEVVVVEASPPGRRRRPSRTDFFSLRTCRPGDGAARAHTGDEHVDLAVGLVPDLGGRSSRSGSWGSRGWRTGSGSRSSGISCASRATGSSCAGRPGATAVGHTMTSAQKRLRSRSSPTLCLSVMVKITL